MDLIRACVVTGTRAEYGLLKPLMELLRSDPAFELQLAVTGTHLAPEFGSTFREIEADGFRIDEQVGIGLDSETARGIGESMGRCLAGFVAAFGRLRPDIVVVLGDRYELFAVAAAATVSRIPVCHISGGDTTEGAFDEAFRHCITKMSHLHFPTTEAYRRRILQMGEDPSMVFNAGSLAVDNVRRLRPLPVEDLEASLGIGLRGDLLLATFHPVTLEGEAAGMAQLEEVLEALASIEGVSTIITGANGDTGGARFNRRIEAFCEGNARMHFRLSLGSLRYLSVMRLAKAVVGNSSSGIIDAPAMGVPTVNVGDRQKGRLRADSVIDVPPVAGAVREGILRGLAPSFQAFARSCPNPYGDGNAAQRIHQLMKTHCGRVDLKKHFFDFG